MSNILTITLNPTIDMSTEVPDMAPEAKLRCAPPRLEPGGGGINVSRAIAILGGHSTAFLALGGLYGRRMRALLANEPFDLAVFDGPGDTRQNLSVTDQSSGQQYRFVMPGPVWSTDEVETLYSALEDATHNADWVVLSGSLPQGMAGAEIPALCNHLQSKGARVLVDISGTGLKALAQSCEAIPDVLRMDDAEAEDLLGRDIKTPEQARDAAQQLLTQRVARMVIIAIGAQGSVLAHGEAVWHARAAKVAVRSKVGAGDSFMAALTMALANGSAPENALQSGTAAACSAVTTPDTQLCIREQAEALRQSCSLTRLTSAATP